MGKLIAIFVLSVYVIHVKCTWVKQMENTGLWQGDIVLDPDEDERKNGTHMFASIKGGRWPGGRVPYVITSSIGAKGVQVINEAISNYHKYTCIRFHKKTSRDKEYISFFRGDGCYSLIGYRKGRVNRISLATGCWNTGIVMHEIGHSVGFLHEQSRPDRDKYVRIIFSNIPTRMRGNFERKSTSQIDSLGTPYDYYSMMHYGPKAFGSGKVTIQTIDPSKQGIIGQRKGFSEIDIKQLGLMYNKVCTGGGGGSTCFDKKTTCGDWVRVGYCTSSKWKDFMHKECCKSCKDGVADTCFDKKKDCGVWAKAGYCTSSEWKEFMRSECCKSCTGDGACFDKKTTCGDWAKVGYCSSTEWKVFMHKECCKSCKGGGGSVISTCTDKKAKCCEWANAGLCSITEWKEDMHKECCKSCKERG